MPRTSDRFQMNADVSIQAGEMLFASSQQRLIMPTSKPSQLPSRETLRHTKSVATPNSRNLYIDGPKTNPRNYAATLCVLRASKPSSTCHNTLAAFSAADNAFSAISGLALILFSS